MAYSEKDKVTMSIIERVHSEKKKEGTDPWSIKSEDLYSLFKETVSSESLEIYHDMELSDMTLFEFERYIQLTKLPFVNRDGRLINSSQSILLD